MEDSISPKQAYIAMFAFLEELYSKFGFDQLGGLLGGMALLSDDKPADEAMWNDWLRAVQKAKSGQVDTGLNIKLT
jgi:hypothetical protein